MLLRVLIALFLASAGCAGDGSIDPPLAGEIRAGSAAMDGTGFVEVADGTVVTLVPGSQGGFHVWLSTSIHGVTGTLHIERTARRVSDNALVYRGQRQLVEIPEEAMDGWWNDAHAIPAFMCPSPIGVKVFDEPLLFEVRLLSDDDEVLASDRLVLEPHCPDGDLAAFCVQICSG